MTEDQLRDLINDQLGGGAIPTGRLRLLSSTNGARLQQEWCGYKGFDWYDVPEVKIDASPKKSRA